MGGWPDHALDGPVSTLIAESTGLIQSVLFALFVPVILHGLKHASDFLGQHPIQGQYL